MLHAQDILVTLKLLSAPSEARASYAALAASVGLSGSEAHGAVRRAMRSGLLISAATRHDSLAQIRPSTAAIHDLLCFGLRYLLPVEVGAPGLGIPTAASAPPLLGKLTRLDGLPHISPHARGNTKGLVVEPIYRSAPAAALRDPELAEWLALADALRLHHGRIADLARREIHARLNRKAHVAAA